jgi:hypothetical protein
MTEALQKPVCKLCRNEDISWNWKWNDQDEEYWEKGKVACPYVFLSKSKALSACDHKPAHNGCLWVIAEKPL